MLRRVLPGPGVEPAQIKPDSATLRWTVQPQTRSYRLQVSRSGNFDPLLLDTRTTTAQYTLEYLSAGQHHVRVSSIGDDGYAGPWGEPQMFTVPNETPQEDWRKLLLLVPLLWLLAL